MDDFYYTAKSSADINKLLDTDKYFEVIREIDKSSCSEADKQFLRLAASRFINFNYEKIADYYFGASPETRQFIEKLHLVVVDYDMAIKRGYIKFKEDYSKFIDEMLKDKVNE